MPLWPYLRQVRPELLHTMSIPERNYRDNQIFLNNLTVNCNTQLDIWIDDLCRSNLVFGGHPIHHNYRENYRLKAVSFGYKKKYSRGSLHPGAKHIYWRIYSLFPVHCSIDVKYIFVGTRRLETRMHFIQFQKLQNFFLFLIFLFYFFIRECIVLCHNV